MHATYEGTLSIFGQQTKINIGLDGDDLIARELANDKAIPAGLAGSLAEATPSSTVTLAEGHGLTTDDLVAVFWDGGKRLGMTISATGSTTITVTTATGAGDALPTGAATPVVVSTPATVPELAFDGDDALAISVEMDQRSVLDFLDGSQTSLWQHEIATAGAGMEWIDGCGLTRPITGNAVASAIVWNGSTSIASGLILVLRNL